MLIVFILESERKKGMKMTRETAIEIFKRLKENAPKEMHLEVVESAEELFEMAIKALSQEPCDKCVYSTKDGYCQYDDISETIPPLEPCDDAISREMALKECHDIVVDGERYRVIQEETLLGLPPVTPKPTECDDAISREAVLKKQYRIDDSATLSTRDVVNVEDIEDEPPVTPNCDKCAMNGSGSKYCDNCKPSRHKGHWIPIYQGDEIINYRCSECELGDTNGSTNLYGWDYCRRCGAEMESEE